MIDGYKICPNKECGKLLPLSSFYKRKNGGILTPCIMCKKKISIDKFKKSKTDIKVKNTLKSYKQKYYKKHKAKILTSTSSYYQKNKSWYQEYQKKYEKSHPRKNRAKSPKNTMQLIRSSISRSISKRIRKNGETKNKSIIPNLSFKFEELKIHLESLFEPWMNWNNYGIYDPKSWKDDDQSTWKWQIDHVKPHSEFPYSSMVDENFKKCWSLENLRPYSAKQNILDGTNRIRHNKGEINE